MSSFPFQVIESVQTSKSKKRKEEKRIKNKTETIYFISIKTKGNISSFTTGLLIGIQKLNKKL